MASLSGLRIQHCHKLWHRSQMWLRSRIAVAAPTGPLAWEVPQGHRYGHKKEKKKMGDNCILDNHFSYSLKN